jgi:hypothetical protein
MLNIVYLGFLLMEIYNETDVLFFYLEFVETQVQSGPPTLCTYLHPLCSYETLKGPKREMFVAGILLKSGLYG